MDWTIILEQYRTQQQSILLDIHVASFVASFLPPFLPPLLPRNPQKEKEIKDSVKIKNVFGAGIDLRRDTEQSIGTKNYKLPGLRRIK